MALPNNPSKTVVALMILLVFFSPLAIDIYLPALPIISQQFAIADTLAQDTITWFIITLGLGQLVAGPLADRFGRRPIALAGIVIYGFSALLAWLATSIDMLLAARLVQGFGACATSVTAFAMVRDCYGPHKSGRMISYLNGAICFIPAMAPILGSWLTAQFGWRSNFSFMAMFALVAFVFILLKLKETRPETSQHNGSYFSLNRYMSVASHPTFIFHSVLCMLSMAVILAYVTSAPVLLMTGLGLSMEQFTFWFAINAVLNIAASFLAPRLMDKYGTFSALNIGLATLVTGAILMFSLSHIAQAWAFMLPIFLSSVGFALVLGASAGKALAPFGNKAGTAAALLGFVQMSGAGLLVAIMQRTSLGDVELIAVLMLMLLPGLILLNSAAGKRWHNPLILD